MTRTWRAQTHENVKYLPGYKLPTNLIAVRVHIATPAHVAGVPGVCKGQDEGRGGEGCVSPEGEG